MKQDTRAAFEKWYGDNYSNYALTLRSGDRYSNLDTELAWQSWQAAIALAVPPGFCVVPKEPTEAMKAVPRRYIHDYGLRVTTNDFVCIYRAMIAAAPSAQEDK